MNLVICCTPLQVLIAERIIALHPEEKFYGVMLVYADSEKKRYYYERLSSVCQNSEYVFLNFTLPYISIWHYLKLRIKSFLLPKFDKVFIASIDSYYCTTLIKPGIKPKIFTFDDGLANIVEDGYFFDKENLSFGRRFFLRCIHNQYSKEHIKRISIVHYSIYKGFKNIIDNVKYIDLFNMGKLWRIDVDKDSNITRILLGQIIYNNEDRDRKLIDRVMKDFTIDLYFPHPAENSKNLPKTKVVESKLIFEDYLSSAILENPHMSFEIFTYFSSAAINILGYPNVKVRSIKPNDLPDCFKSSYSIFERKNIPIITNY